MSGDGFAGRLRELREAAGLSQAELAELAGLHRFGVAKLEQGVREPSWATVQALADALGVDCRAFQGAKGKTVPRSPGRPPKKPVAPSPAKKGRKGKGA